MTRLRYFFTILFALICLPSAAQQRNCPGIAIVIANSKYRNAQDTLHCPRTEGIAISNKLSSLGYQVYPFFDASHDEMMSGIQMVAEQSKYLSSIILYYTGHGIQGMTPCDSIWSLQNYLVPIDGKAGTNADVATTCVSLSSIVQVINRYASSTTKRILFIDACRTMPSCGITQNYGDPFSGVRLIGYENFWTFYSTEDNQQASDGDGLLGPYATAWLEAADISGIRLKEFSKYIEQRVQELTDGKQIPVYSKARYEFTINANNDSTSQRKPILVKEKTISRSNWGKLLYANGDWYEGYILDGEEHGYGIKHYSNGDRYEGSWKNGKRNGGDMYYANGDQYYGGWTMDKKDGTGYFYSGDSLCFGLWYADSCYEGEIYDADNFSLTTGKGLRKSFRPKERSYFSADDMGPNSGYTAWSLWWSPPTMLGINIYRHERVFKIGLEGGFQLTDDMIESHITTLTDSDSSISIRDTGRAFLFAITGSYTRKYMSFTLSIGALCKSHAQIDYTYNRTSGEMTSTSINYGGSWHPRLAIMPSIQFVLFPGVINICASIGYRWVLHERRYSGLFIGIGFH